METKQDNFAAFAAASEQAQSHAQEIQQTRVGGLGGSDAAMVYKVGLNGLLSLSATDVKRLAVMVGTYPAVDWGGNAHTNAGHAFEDYAEQVLPFGRYGYEREAVFKQPLARAFDVFAHADFVCGSTHSCVIECKYVQQDTAHVVEKYYPQLQWYYMLGAQSVHLYHGRGSVEPFEVEEACVQLIERDEPTIAILLNGIKTIDDALCGGWFPKYDPNF